MELLSLIERNKIKENLDEENSSIAILGLFVYAFKLNSKNIYQLEALLNFVGDHSTISVL